MQIPRWRTATGSPERLVAGEVRTIAVSLAPDQPQSATVSVRSVSAD